MNIAEYVITTITGNKLGAGTDSNVFIVVYGDKAQTAKIQLKNTETQGDPFEKGKTDIFRVNGLNCGNMSKINVSHDGFGVGCGWFLDSVTVKNVATGQTKK